MEEMCEQWSTSINPSQNKFKSEATSEQMKTRAPKQPEKEGGKRHREKINTISSILGRVFIEQYFSYEHAQRRTYL